MKRLRWLRYFFLVVVVALLLTSGVGAQSPCEVAHSLLTAKIYPEAQSAYESVLKNASLNASQRDCALTGIKELRYVQAEELYTLGKKFEEQKNLDDARTAYINALKINPNFIDAQSALVRINDPFALVRTLANTGFYTDAESKFKDVVAKNPNISVPEDLNYLNGGKIDDWRKLKLLYEPWILTFGEIFVLIVIILMVYSAIRYKILLWIKGFFYVQFDITDFKGATGLDGEGMKVLVEESYMQLGEKGRSRLNLIDKPLDNIQIPEIPSDIKGAPYLNTIFQLIKWVFPQKVITLNGYLHMSEDFGAGITLTMVKWTGKIVANHTIWQKDFNPTWQKDSNSNNTTTKDITPYYRLAKIAGIWTLFQVYKQKSSLSKIGTENWLSFAYLRAGVFWYMEGGKENKDKAHQLYVKALNEDINHKHVWFNLGVLDNEDGDYDRAIDRLFQTQKLSKPEDPDYLWYLATYQLAAAYHYRSIKTKKDLDQAQKDLDQAQTISDDLVKKLEKMQEPKEKLSKVAKLKAWVIALWKKSGSESKEKLFKEQLKLFDQSANIMHASILADQGKKEEAEKKVNSIIERSSSRFSYRVHYNLACYYSIVGNKTDTNAYKKALNHLEYALESGGNIITWAKDDLSLEGLRKDKKEAFYELINKYKPTNK